MNWRLDRDRRLEAVPLSLAIALILLICVSPSILADDGRRDYVRYAVNVEYNPWGFTLALDFGLEGNNLTLTRGWVEDKYTYLVSENFTATRQVIAGYKKEPIYDVWAWYVPGAPQFQGLDEDLADCGWRVLQGLGSRRDEEFWMNYFWTEGRWPLKGVEPNTFQDPWEFAYPHQSYGWIAFQGFTDWRRKTVYILRGQVPGAYGIWIPYQFHYLVEVGERQLPIYEDQEYVIYHNTLYEVTDYILDNWPVLRAKVTLCGENGYEGEVRLSVKADDNLIGVDLADEVLHVASEASTELTISPGQEFQGSSALITVTASDPSGRTRAIDLRLAFMTEPKPPIENVVLDEWESEAPPAEVGEIRAEYKGWIGVEGRVYDSRTGEPIPLVTGDVSVNGFALRKGSYTLKGLNGLGQYWYMDLVWDQDKVENYTVKVCPRDYRPQIKTTSDRTGDEFVLLDFRLEPRFP